MTSGSSTSTDESGTFARTNATVARNSPSLSGRVNAPEACSPEFLVSTLGDPHLQRRRSLLSDYPELKQLVGHNRNTTYIAVLLVAIQLGSAFLFQRYDLPWWVWLAAAWAIGGTLNHWLGMIIHEAAHNLVWSGGQVPNRWIAMFANIPILFPAAMSFRRYHLDHHRYLGVIGRDNDLPQGFELRGWWGTRLGKFIWSANFLFVSTLARGFWNKPDRWEVINVVLQAMVVVGLWATVGFGGLGYLLLSTYLGFGLHPSGGHWVHEHYLLEGEQETSSYYGPLNAVVCNVGYHVEHHDLPSIPGAKLPDVRRIAAPYYDNLSRSNSWVKVWFDFIMKPTIGHHSRVVRSLSSLKTPSESAATFPALDRACLPRRPSSETVIAESTAPHSQAA